MGEGLIFLWGRASVRPLPHSHWICEMYTVAGVKREEIQWLWGKPLRRIYFPVPPRSKLTAPQPMGVVSATADAVVALFSLIMAVAGPLFDSQIVLPRCLYPAPLVDIHRWFIGEFDHYLVADPPPFFRGLVWLELAFLWPVCVANLYCILARRRWAATTSLMAGVYMLTYLSAILGDMLGSGRATPKLLQLYVPFVVFAVTAVLRGLCSCSALATAGSSSAQKKRV